MKNKILALFSLILIIFGCNNYTSERTTTLDGDLYFGFFRHANFYGLPDSIVKKTINYVEGEHLSTETDTLLLETYALLKKEKLLYTPYIQLRTNSDSIITVFLEKHLYNKIAPTNYKALVQSKKKLKVSIQALELNDKLYRGTKILSVDTLQDNVVRRLGKFEIKDYQ